MTEQDSTRVDRFGPLNMGPYRYAAIFFVVLGVINIGLVVSIALSGDLAYGLLYTGPASISFIFAVAFWGLRQNV